MFFLSHGSDINDIFRFWIFYSPSLHCLNQVDSAPGDGCCTPRTFDKTFFPLVRCFVLFMHFTKKYLDASSTVLIRKTHV